MHQTVYTRGGGGYENDPVPSNTDAKFVCRNGPKTPEITIVAGTTIEVEWTFTANHLGDGALYLSYGDDKFFKIANFPEMNLSNNQFHTVRLPAWLPASDRAVLRWEWYALHVYPGGDGSGGGGPDEGSFEAFMHQHFPENTRLVDGVVVLDERVQGEEWRGRFERIDASTELHDLGPAPQET